MNYPTYEEFLLEGEPDELTTEEVLARLAEEDIADPISDLPVLTPEEARYFDTQHDLSAAIQKATKAATKALGSWNATDLSDAGFAFECAAARARIAAQAEYARDAAFKLTEEYRAQQAKGGNA